MGRSAQCGDMRGKSPAGPPLKALITVLASPMQPPIPAAPRCSPPPPAPPCGGALSDAPLFRRPSRLLRSPARARRSRPSLREGGRGTCTSRPAAPVPLPARSRHLPPCKAVLRVWAPRGPTAATSPPACGREEPAPLPAAWGRNFRSRARTPSGARRKPAPGPRWGRSVPDAGLLSGRVLATPPPPRDGETG